MPMNAQIRAVARLNRWGDYLWTEVGMWTMHYLHQLGWLSRCCEWNIQHINGFGILFTNSIMFKHEFPMAYQAQSMTWVEAMPVGLRQGFFCSKKGHESRDCPIPKPNSAVDGWKELAQRLGKTRCFACSVIAISWLPASHLYFGCFEFKWLGTWLIWTHGLGKGRNVHAIQFKVFKQSK